MKLSNDVMMHVHLQPNVANYDNDLNANQTQSMIAHSTGLYTLPHSGRHSFVSQKSTQQFGGTNDSSAHVRKYQRYNERN